MVPLAPVLVKFPSLILFLQKIFPTKTNGDQFVKICLNSGRVQKVELMIDKMVCLLDRILDSDQWSCNTYQDLIFKCMYACISKRVIHIFKLLIMIEQLQVLKTHLSVVKQSPADQIEEQFYNLMVRAKQTLGEASFHMAHFYYQYSNFILTRLERNIDLFNAEAVPSNAQNNQEDSLDDIVQEFQDSTPENESPQLQKQQQDMSQQKLNAPQNRNFQLQQKLAAGQQNERVIQQQDLKQWKGQYVQTEKIAKQIPNGQVDPSDDQMDDKQLCAINLEFAITIYQSQLQKMSLHQSEANEEEVLDGLRRCRSRLGDLLAIDQDYENAILQYRHVIAQQQLRKGAKHNRLISQLYFLIGNCFLYDNKPGCENEAIISYIKSTQILISNLCLVDNYYALGIVAPSLEKIQVDRFPFLNKASDSEQIKQIKEVITCLLDKIEDTYEQISVKGVYQAEKRKQQQQQKKMQFKPVAEDVKVINLGSFGNRKRKPEVQIIKEVLRPTIAEQQKVLANVQRQKQGQQVRIGKENNSMGLNNDS